MRLSLLDLISTPVPILNTLGVDVAVGLSSDDPIADRRPTEAYESWLSIYAPDGTLLERLLLGVIAPGRRRLFDLSALTRARIPAGDHLAVVHRIPVRLRGGGAVEEPVDVDPADVEYAMYRSLVQYSYPDGSNGSVIYETPPAFNRPRPGRPPASTLTFTSKIVMSDTVDTCLALMNYSLDPDYRVHAEYRYALFAPDGRQVAAGRADIAPFGVTVISTAGAVPSAARTAYRDAADGLTWLTYVGYCRDTAIIPLVLTLSPRRRTVSVEHTHPAQAYTVPARPGDKHKVKAAALAAWARRLEVNHAAP